MNTSPESRALSVPSGSASEKPYDPLDSLEKEVERFMRTNLFTPMEVTGFYIQARCVISELRGLRKENEYLRNVRERQTDLLRRWADWARAHGHDIGVLDDTRDSFPPNHRITNIEK